MKRHYLYRHLRKTSLEPFYIGIGTKQDREYYNLKGEFERAYSSYSRNNLWHNIVGKCGFLVQILFQSNNYNKIKEKEKYFINLYGRIDINDGILCNLTDGGDGLVGWNATEQQRKNLSESHKGKTIPKDVRDKMSKSRKKYLSLNPKEMKGKNHPKYGTKNSKETRRKISEAQKGEKHHFYGKSHSEETKRKMSESHKGRVHSKETRKKISDSLCKKVICVETGKTFESITDASKKLNRSTSNISAHCNGEYKTQKFKFI